MPDPWGMEDVRFKTGFTDDCTILISNTEFNVIWVRIVTFSGPSGTGKGMCACACVSACMRGYVVRGCTFKLDKTAENRKLFLFFQRVAVTRNQLPSP